jgi:hypothetical protein
MTDAGKPFFSLMFKKDCKQFRTDAREERRSSTDAIMRH